MSRTADLVYRSLEKEERRPHSESHYPTDARREFLPYGAIGKCLRAQFYSHTGVEPTNPPNASGILKMRLGNAIGVIITEALERAVDVVSEVQGRKDIPGCKLPMSYRVDNLYLDENGKTMGIEVKSTYGAGIDAVKRDGAKPEHLMQATLYEWATGFPFKLLYVDRESGFIYEPANSTAPSLLEYIFQSWRELEKHLEANTLPPRDYQPNEKTGEEAEAAYEEYTRGMKRPQGIEDWRGSEKGKRALACSWNCRFCSWGDKCKGEK